MEKKVGNALEKKRKKRQLLEQQLEEAKRKLKEAKQEEAYAESKEILAAVKNSNLTIHEIVELINKASIKKNNEEVKGDKSV